MLFSKNATARFAAILLPALIAAPGSAVAQEADAGNGGLVIVGGALKASNTAVYERFLEMAGGVEAARIGIIPAASGRPDRNARRFVDDMVALGVSEDRITVHPIATEDDSGTDDVDESTWVTGGDDPDVAEAIEAETAIWMIGGDQMRLRQTLLDEAGAPLAAARAMRALLDAGGVVGGTSAGAAILSDVMIASGDSLGALSEGLTDTYGAMEEQEFGPVHLSQGLGFFPYGILDQHFDRKARYGRLVVALAAQDGGSKLGFGIEEDTALVVTEGEAEVIGAGGVHVIDMSAAETGALGVYDDVRLSYFRQGDRWDFAEGFVNAAEKYDTIGGDEYYATPSPSVTGAFSRNAQLRDLIGFDLVDNSAANEVTSYLFDPATGEGFALTFAQDETTKGYWRALDGQADSYSYTGVRLDIAPVTVYVEPAEE